jgi:RNA polymerase subunit RPABC4/transcription elongation factor Spt4
MFCGNCGKEVSEKAVACPNCGVPPRAERKYCYNCATATDAKQAMCIKCGVSLAKESVGEKSMVAAGILAVIPLTGALGIHRFYLGYTGMGIAHVALLLVGIPLLFIFIGVPILLGNSNSLAI